MTNKKFNIKVTKSSTPGQETIELSYNKTKEVANKFVPDLEDNTWHLTEVELLVLRSVINKYLKTKP